LNAWVQNFELELLLLFMKSAIDVIKNQGKVNEARSGGKNEISENYLGFV
jgi:hypothetical protein